MRGKIGDDSLRMLRLAERGEDSRYNREFSLAAMTKDIPGF